MNYQIIDLAAYPRQAHFQYFSKMENPYVGVSVNVDIQSLRVACRERQYPFFLTLLHTVSAAANAVPAFRQRICNGQIWEFDHCDTSHVVLHEDGTYSYCRLDCRGSLEAFLPGAILANDYAKAHPTLDDGADGCSLFFISCLPWLHYTALVQPTPHPADSNVRITWGKYVEESGRCLLPVSVLANHALVDGLHLAEFYRLLQETLDSFKRD